jgi:hypothetical protein
LVGEARKRGSLRRRRPWRWGRAWGRRRRRKNCSGGLLHEFIKAAKSDGKFGGIEP